MKDDDRLLPPPLKGAGSVLGSLCFAAMIAWMAMRGPQVLAERHSHVVTDLLPYGAELRALDTSCESPADPDPGGPTDDSIPGWYPRRTADGAYTAVTISRGGFDFFHTVAVWDAEPRKLTRVLSIKESDPHSGIAHRYAWSKDSKALLIHGSGRLPETHSIA
jgi:hypothetical protein